MAINNLKGGFMIKFKQGEFVDLFRDKMRGLISSRTGTYNKADPTHFEKMSGELWVINGYGEYFMEDENGMVLHDSKPIPEEPPPIKVKIEIHDCTWGVEFKFTTDIGECGAYWSRNFGSADHEKNPEGGEWLRVTGNFFDVFKDLLVEGQTINPYEDYIHESLSDYE
jgi:hypothetical protein